MVKKENKAELHIIVNDEFLNLDCTLNAPVKKLYQMIGGMEVMKKLIIEEIAKSLKKSKYDKQSPKG